MYRPAIEVEGLRKTFGQVAAPDGLSFLVPAGSVLGLLGPNGSGKTTTVSILSTALRPDGGRATVQNLDVVADAPHGRAPDPVSVAVREPTLDDVFLARTGGDAA